MIVVKNIKHKLIFIPRFYLFIQLLTPTFKGLSTSLLKATQGSFTFTQGSKKKSNTFLDSPLNLLLHFSNGASPTQLPYLHAFPAHWFPITDMVTSLSPCLFFGYLFPESAFELYIALMILCTRAHKTSSTFPPLYPLVKFSIENKLIIPSGSLYFFCSPNLQHCFNHLNIFESL